MISFNKIENYTGIYLGDVSIIEVYSGEHKVWPDKELKFKRISQDGTVYELPCDGNSTLTSAETRGDLTSADISGDTNPVTSITIGDCVTEIGNGAFSGWSKVTGDLVIPDSVETIGDNAFKYCSGLTGNLVISDSVNNIGTYAFQWCSGFTGTLTLPTGLTEISAGIFYGCIGLTSITIGTDVTTIGNNAFDTCSKLKSIYCKATTPPTLGNLVFYGTNNCPIYVPSESVDAYKSASGWSNYADRILPMP